MGFGGGGSGSFVLPNHKHTNILADGGELEELVSLVDGATMKVWVTAEAAAAKSVFTEETDKLTSTFTTGSITKVPITGLSVVLGGSGQALILGYITEYNTNLTTNHTDLYDGTNIISSAGCTQTGGYEDFGALGGFMTMSNETITMRASTSLGALTYRGTTSVNNARQTQLTVVKIT